MLTIMDKPLKQKKEAYSELNGESKWPARQEGKKVQKEKLDKVDWILSEAVNPY
jgi:hypothetical protein